MKSSAKGFSPEQIATGCLDNGKEVVILYIKEFSEQLNKVGQSRQLNYLYNWSKPDDGNSIILYICWENNAEIAVVFMPNQYEILESMRDPKELIITGIPINLLVEHAQENGQDFFDLKDNVVYLQDVTYKEPELPN
jgi:hypothetical protein